MQRVIYGIVFIILGFLLLRPGLAQAQQSLMELSSQQSIQWRAERAYAESVAIAQHMPIRVDRPDGSSIELQRIENGIPLYAVTTNLNAAKTLSTNKLWPGGISGYSLTGANDTLWEWDAGGARATHHEFGGRVVGIQANPVDHSTHVGGTMIAAGLQAAAHGMAPGASLISLDWNDVVAELASQAARGAQLGNHSWGYITGWYYNYFGDSKWAWFGDTAVSATVDYKYGFYSTDARDWDNVLASAAYLLPVVAAGNDRGTGPGSTVGHWVRINGSWVWRVAYRENSGGSTGFDCISGFHLSKNVLTVGAVNGIPGGYGGPSSVVMTSFSGWGPADDGRIKPDVVADGVNLYSTLSTNDSAYGTMSGTSMATPNVTGSMGLLLQYQKMLHGSVQLRASTLKAIVINTADEAGPYPGPDYMFGWGLMNTLKAVQLMTADSADGDGSHIREALLLQGDTLRFDISATGIEPLKASIAWTDPPGVPVAPALNPRTKMLVNDLDLRIIRKRNGTTSSPWVLDVNSPASAATTGDNSTDNVEQVFIQSPERTVYTVQISHKGTLSGGSQYVSFAVSGNTRMIGPIAASRPTSFTLSVLPSSVHADSLELMNYGDSTMHWHSTASDSSMGWLSSVETTGDIASMDSDRVHFTANAGSLGLWKTYSGSLNFFATDTTSIPYKVSVILHTLGPTAFAAPAALVRDVDSGLVKLDSILIRNDGYTPLNFWVRDTGAALPAWLGVSPGSGTLSPHESTYVQLSFSTVLLPVGDYHTQLEVASNDSVTGPILMPVTLHAGTRRILGVSVHENWNLLSLPVLPFVTQPAALFPLATTGAYTYAGTYLPKDTLLPGFGFWMRMDTSMTVPIEGYIFTSTSAPVAAGWSLIGSLSSPAPVSAVTSLPEGIISSFVFGYGNGYFTPDTLYPGHGYWIKTNQPGTILIDGSALGLRKVQRAELPLSQFSQITVTDRQGTSQTLYFGDPLNVKGSLPATGYDMPPRPPEGSFDARFASGRMLQLLNEGEECRVHIQAAAYPVVLRWNLKTSDAGTFILTDEAGKALALDTRGSFTITGSTPATKTLRLTRGTSDIPREFALRQNFPNPFNPSTRIAYDLPQAQHVSLKIYNLLGNEVATLVDGTQDAGHKAVEFWAENLPSGVYLYKLVTEKFTSTRKMLLMK